MQSFELTKQLKISKHRLHTLQRFGTRSNADNFFFWCLEHNQRVHYPERILNIKYSEDTVASRGTAFGNSGNFKLVVYL